MKLLGFGKFVDAYVNNNDETQTGINIDGGKEHILVTCLLIHWRKEELIGSNKYVEEEGQATHTDYNNLFEQTEQLLG